MSRNWVTGLDTEKTSDERDGDRTDDQQITATACKTTGSGMNQERIPEADEAKTRTIDKGKY